MKLRKAIYTAVVKTRTVGCLATVTQEVDVRVIAIAEGYAMVRRKGAVPFVCTVKELRQVTR